MDINYTTDPLFKLEGWLKVAFVLTTLLYLPFSFYKTLQISMAVAICLLGIKRQIKAFALNMATLKAVAQNEFGNCLFYVAFLLCVSDPSMAFYLPLDLYFLVGISEFVSRGRPSLLMRSEKITGAAEIIKSFKDLIKVSRTFCEVFLFFYVVILTVMGKMNFLAAIMCFNYLRLKGASPVGRYCLVEMQREASSKLQGIVAVQKIVDGFFGLLTKY